MIDPFKKGFLVVANKSKVLWKELDFRGRKTIDYGPNLACQPFCKQFYWNSVLPFHIYTHFYGCFHITMATEIIWPSMPKKITIWSITEKVFANTKLDG